MDELNVLKEKIERLSKESNRNTQNTSSISKCCYE